MDDIAEKIQSLLSDEESMKQIQELAAMFSGTGDAGAQDASEKPAPEQNENGKEENAPGINPLALMQLFGSVSQKDNDSELLLALKPHLSAEKQKRIDKAVKLLKLYNIFVALRDNGMLNDLENLL